MAGRGSGQFSYLTRPRIDDVNKVVAVAEKPLGKKGEEVGVVYAAATVTQFQELYIKVGWSTKDGHDRVNNIKKKCQLSVDGWGATKPFRGAYRAEQIIHAFLKEYNVPRMMCSCEKRLVDHREWFRVQHEHVTELIHKAYDWMVNSQPYDASGKLKEKSKAEILAWRFDLLHASRMPSRFPADVSPPGNLSWSFEAAYRQNDTTQPSTHAQNNISLDGTLPWSLPANATPPPPGEEISSSTQDPDLMDYTMENLNDEQPLSEIPTTSPAQSQAGFWWVHYRDHHDTDSPSSDTPMQSDSSDGEEDTTEYFPRGDSRTIGQFNTDTAFHSLGDNGWHWSDKFDEVQSYQNAATNTSLDRPNSANIHLGEVLNTPVTEEYPTVPKLGFSHSAPNLVTPLRPRARATLEPPCTSSGAQSSRRAYRPSDSGTMTIRNSQGRRSSTALLYASEAKPGSAPRHGRSKSENYP